MTRIEIEAGLWAHCSGALYITASSSLVIADAHLGYGWAQRRRGQLGPTADGGIEERLLRVIDEFAPSEVLFLGDTVHAPKPGLQERQFIESLLVKLLERSALRVVEGNHDRAFHRDFGHLPIPVEKQWRHGDMLALHGDRLHLELPEAGYYLIGHYHPAVGLRDSAGAVRRAPAFCVGPKATLLPAFSPFAAGLDLTRSRLPKEAKELLGEFRVMPATGTRIAELPLAMLRTLQLKR
jgi:putative SbcD/Mre11-related phosphoesterase